MLLNKCSCSSDYIQSFHELKYLFHFEFLLVSLFGDDTKVFRTTVIGGSVTFRGLLLLGTMRKVGVLMTLKGGRYFRWPPLSEFYGSICQFEGIVVHTIDRMYRFEVRTVLIK